MGRRAGISIVVVVSLLVGGVGAAGADGPRASFHGDSMGAQAKTQIRNRLENGYTPIVDARERARIDTMVGRIRTMAQSSPPEIAIVELGAGDAHAGDGDAKMRREIRQVLDVLRAAEVPCVRWLNLKVGGVSTFYQGYVVRAGAFNRILAAEMSRYPAQFRVANYKAWAAGHRGAFKPDGLHHTTVGKSQYAAYVKSVARSCPPPG